MLKKQECTENILKTLDRLASRNYITKDKNAKYGSRQSLTFRGLGATHDFKELLYRPISQVLPNLNQL